MVLRFWGSGFGEGKEETATSTGCRNRGTKQNNFKYVIIIITIIIKKIITSSP